MRIAFYAPLKAPDHPVPSGDRQVARLLVAALGVGGHEVVLVSRLRSREARGNAADQQMIRSRAGQEVANLSARLLEDPPDIWFTYHLYYKAPDLIGPEVCRVLGIPYVVAEASHAEKRLQGLHADFAATALQAMKQAAAVVCITARDHEGLAECLPVARLHRLKPFVPARPRPAVRPERQAVRLLAVGMMRPGDKLDSYRLLARVLLRLQHHDWTLTIVGDGEASVQVRGLFQPLRERVRFVGAVSAARLNAIYGQHDLCLWPAVNEAYGMALLEATAHGLPVIAGDEGGVRDVIRHGENGLLVARRDPDAMARAVSGLLRQPRSLRRLQNECWRRIERGHRLSQAARSLNKILATLC